MTATDVLDGLGWVRETLYQDRHVGRRQVDYVDDAVAEIVSLRAERDALLAALNATGVLAAWQRHADKDAGNTFPEVLDVLREVL